VTVPDIPISIGDQAPVTGHEAVDAALRDLAAAAGAAPHEMILPLAEADRVLRETLDTVDDTPPLAGPGDPTRPA
jgi:hypothetical protein